MSLVDSQDAMEVTFDWSNFWLVRMLFNLGGYATVIIPGFLFIRYIRNSAYLDKAGSGRVSSLIRLLVEGSSSLLPDHDLSSSSGISRSQCSASDRSLARHCVVLFYCSVGLLSSYLVWGLLQERIMAYNYIDNTSSQSLPSERFTNSQFLVFMNRILAFCVAVVIISMRRQRVHRQPPLYKYSYGSVSNIVSSWCQYEALKFVSFPVQVLAKAAKVIPVMLMGRLVSRRSYSYSDYCTAAAISIGLFLFLETSTSVEQGSARERATTTVSGLILLISYLAFDSFTSNWQAELFHVYRVSSVEMMAGVNVFSVLLTSASLLEQGAFSEAVSFASRHPLFLAHVLVLSATSAVGQLFIFHTISEFGAVTFTIIMTVRQGLAILLSCIVYHHPVSAVGALGILVVFVAIFFRVYIGHTRRKSPVKSTDLGPNTSGPSGPRSTTVAATSPGLKLVKSESYSGTLKNIT